MQLFKSLLCAFFIMTVPATVESSVIKTFNQGPQKHYLLNSSELFYPTDYIAMDSPVYDIRSVVINSGIVGGQSSFNPEGIESHAIRDTTDNDYFYQIWHLAHIDTKHSRTNVISIIVSLGDIGMSPSGDIEDTNRALDTDTKTTIYVQVYRAWSLPVTIPLTQANMDGWWHSITHAFHAAMHIWNEVKPWVGVARTVIPILISMSDDQAGLGLKSISYEPIASDATTTTTSATNTNTDTSVPFSYAITPGEMSAIVIFVFLSGVGITIVVPRLFCVKKTYKEPLINDKVTTDIESLVQTNTMSRLL